MQRTTDTIAAVATAPGQSGIGIVRVSGEDAIQIVQKIFDRDIADAETHTIHYGHVVDGTETVDEVLLMLMKAPHTYTGEDTVELDCHGGILVTDRVLKTVLKAGANLAEPGEFTKRAFLNGKTDLSRAEAVIDVIDAKNRDALRAGMMQLSGKLSAEIRDLRAQILHELAYIEAALDDPEHYDLTGYPQALKKILGPLTVRVEALLENADNGRVMKEGINTVILGKPNAGKSSLLNLMTGEDRAIVTEIAGTTRDILTEQILISGISLNVTDTAGIRESRDVVEKIGVERARKAADAADLILVMIDGSLPLDENDHEVLQYAETKKAVVLLNKSDLQQIVKPEMLEKETSHPVIVFSAKDGTGLKELEKTIREMFYHGTIDFNDQIYITNERHRDALERAGESLRKTENSIEAGLPEDFFSIDLRDAYETLGVITGETVEDDVINEIFSKFCMGK
jgi:tRNA modification GTPase